MNEKINIKQEFKCEICSRVLFTNKGAFSNHVKLHDPEFKKRKGDKIRQAKIKFYQDKERSEFARNEASERMKIDNPMTNPETIEKMVSSRKEYFANMTDEEYNKFVINFINAPKKGNAVNHSGKYTTTKPERIVIDFNIPGLIYNGNKKESKTIRFKNKNYRSSLTPDFICENDSSKIVEVFGIYWHPKEHIKLYVNACNENGYNILILWENDLYDNPEYEKQKIIKFLGD